jgi:RNA polymerase sigma-70 factor (ECF subfamily)
VTAEQERAAAELFARAMNGDRQAYGEFLTDVGRAARAYVRMKAGAVPWVEDVVQETLLAVHRARRTYDPRRPLAPWVYAIAKNRLVDAIRRERRTAAREVADDRLPEAAAIAPPAEDAMDPQLLAALQSLPARQREIVESLKLRDESVRDVSRRLRMSETYVKVSAHRGYAALRRLLGAEPVRKRK